MPTKMTGPELTKQILDVMEQLGCKVWGRPGTGGWAGLVRKEYTGGKYSRGKGGVPDITGWYGVKILAIEVKGDGDRLRPAQQDYLDRVDAAGGIAITARSVDDVLKRLI